MMHTDFIKIYAHWRFDIHAIIAMFGTQFLSEVWVKLIWWWILFKNKWSPLQRNVYHLTMINCFGEDRTLFEIGNLLLILSWLQHMTFLVCNHSSLIWIMDIICEHVLSSLVLLSSVMSLFLLMTNASCWVCKGSSLIAFVGETQNYNLLHI